MPSLVVASIAMTAREIERAMAETKRTTEQWRAVVADFVAALREKYGDNLDRVLLYGSRARGDYDEDSDVDTIVALKHIDDYRKRRQEVWDIAYSVSFDSGRPVLFSAVLFERGELETGRGPFRLNVRREAVPVWWQRSKSARH